MHLGSRWVERGLCHILIGVHPHRPKQRSEWRYRPLQRLAVTLHFSQPEGDALILISALTAVENHSCDFIPLKNAT